MAYNNENHWCYNTKLYQFMRENRSWDNIVMYAIEILETDDLVAVKRRQTELIKIHDANLNMRDAYRSKEETLAKKRIQGKKYREKNKDIIKGKQNEKNQCYCGGNYTKQHQARHYKTATHILNDPVYTKHRRENLIHYQIIDIKARTDPSLISPYILLCWKLREEKLKT